MATRLQDMESKSKTPLSKVTKLRQLLRNEEDIVVCPGVYDGFTARIALAAGFDCLYMVYPSRSIPIYPSSTNNVPYKTGAGTTMSRIGLPDLGVATLNDMRDNASMIAGLDRDVPLIADADTGYGGAL